MHDTNHDTTRLHPVRQVRGAHQGEGRRMEDGPTTVQDVSQRVRLTIYTICGLEWEANSLLHAVAMASRMYDYKQFWVYNAERTRLLGIYRRIDQ